MGQLVYIIIVNKTIIPYKLTVRSNTLLFRTFMPSTEGATVGTPCSCSNWSITQAWQITTRDRLTKSSMLVSKRVWLLFAPISACLRSTIRTLVCCGRMHNYGIEADTFTRDCEELSWVTFEEAQLTELRHTTALMVSVSDVLENNILWSFTGITQCFWVQVMDQRHHVRSHIPLCMFFSLAASSSLDV